MTSYEDYLLLMEAAPGTQILSEPDYYSFQSYLEERPGDPMTVEGLYQVEVDLGRAVPIEQALNPAPPVSPFVLLIVAGVIFYVLLR